MFRGGWDVQLCPTDRVYLDEEVPPRSVVLLCCCLLNLTMRSRPEASVECKWWDLRSLWGMLLIVACTSLSCLHRDRYLVMEE